MAKKSLKKRIDDLVDALGGAQKPTLAEIRSELVSIGTIAQELEDGQALSEKEAAISTLEAENENLKVELQTANAELETFRAERRKQEGQNQQKEIPAGQFEILNRLSHESGYGDTLNDIAAVAKITVDEAEIHMDRLRKAGFAKRKYTWAGDWLWRRTMAGNEYVAPNAWLVRQKYPSDIDVSTQTFHRNSMRQCLRWHSTRERQMSVRLAEKSARAFFRWRRCWKLLKRLAWRPKVKSRKGGVFWKQVRTTSRSEGFFKLQTEPLPENYVVMQTLNMFY
jgi:hypothetical protein